jgi:type II secretory pathway pseudopilin PulG
MNRQASRGLTLIELLIAITIVMLIGVAAASLVNACLQGYTYATSEKSALLREGMLAMERMTRGVRTSTHVRTYLDTPGDYDILVFSGLVNADGDSYLGNADLFPRVDEDDTSDANNDGSPGIRGMDDDEDGTIDEGASADDDEDGTADEDGRAIIYYQFEPDTNTLWEHFDGSEVWNDVATHVTDFTVTDEPADGTHARRISVSLTLTNQAGENMVFFEYAYPRNEEQRTGKRVL